MSSFRPNDEFIEMYNQLRRKMMPETVADIKKNGHTKDFVYSKTMRKNQPWTKKEDTMIHNHALCDTRIAFFSFRTIRGVHEHRNNLRRKSSPQSIIS